MASMFRFAAIVVLVQQYECYSYECNSTRPLLKKKREEHRIRKGKRERERGGEGESIVIVSWRVRAVVAEKGYLYTIFFRLFVFLWRSCSLHHGDVAERG